MNEETRGLECARLARAGSPLRVYDPAARPHARGPMGCRNPDTIEDTRARNYSKNTQEPQPAGLRESSQLIGACSMLQGKSVTPASRLLANRASSSAHNNAQNVLIVVRNSET